MSKRISELTPLESVTGDEELPLAKNGLNVKITLGELRKTVVASDISDLDTAVTSVINNLNLNVSLQKSEW